MKHGSGEKIWEGECITPEKRRTIVPYDQLAAIFERCAWCGGEIYLGQSYYATEDGSVCMDCLPDYAHKYFLSALSTALPQDPRA